MRAPNWTDQELEWLRTNYPAMGLAECAQHLNRTQAAVRIRLNKLGKRAPATWLGLGEGKQTKASKWYIEDD